MDIIQKKIDESLELVGLRENTLVVVPKPTLLNFNIAVNYPDYTGIKDEELQNTGDLFIPEGTNLEWIFNTENTDVIEMFFSDQKLNAVKDGKSSFKVARRAMTNELYKIGIGNQQVYNNDTISYTITVIPDAFPEISAEQFKDSTDEKFLYFLGEINDDYGFKSMYFKYKVEGIDAGENFFVKEEKIPYYTTNVMISACQIIESHLLHVHLTHIVTIFPNTVMMI